MKDCPNDGGYTCTVNYWAKERGCGKRMCNDHRSKKCYYRPYRGAPPPNVCTECEKSVQNFMLKMNILPAGCFCCFCFFILGMILFSVTMSATEDSTGDTSLDVCKLQYGSRSEVAEGYKLMNREDYLGW